MERYLWCTPVLPGKSRVITDKWIRTLFDFTDPDVRREADELADRIGLADLNVWVQHTHMGDLAIYLWETEDWDRLWSEFRAMVEEGHPRAVAVHTGVKEVLGVDFCDPAFTSKPEMLAHYEWGKLPANRVVRFAEAWPILKRHESNRRQFSDSCNQENRDSFEALAKSLGLIAISRGLSQSGSQTYYVVYGECDTETWSQYQEFLRARENEWLWDKLMEDTGFTREQIVPHTEWIHDSPPIRTRR